RPDNVGASRGVTYPFSSLLADKAMRRVGLPICIERTLNEGAKAFLAFAQLILGPSQLRDVLQHAELAQRLVRRVPRHVALTVNCSLRAIRADHPVFNVVAGTTARQRSRPGLGYSRPVLWMNQLEPTLVPLRQVDRLQSED